VSEFDREHEYLGEEEMSEENRARAQRWMQEIWNERREATIDELMHPEAIGHMEGGDVHGPSGFKAARASLLDALPDLTIEVEDSVSENDSVVLRWRVSGTHKGSGLGLPPTGRPVSFRGMSWFRLENGQMVEGWDSWNLGALLEDLRT
jgi:steroid delta-isomerase-like uncharacterized protein